MDPIREQILNEARKLFYLYGFKKVSMDEIATACKMSKKTIYQFYSSKDELVTGCVDKIATAKISEILEVLEVLGSKTLMTGELRKLLEIFSSLSQELSEVMVRDMMAFPNTWNLIEEKRMAVFAKIGGVIEQGKVAGGIRKELNTDLFLRIFMGILQKFFNPSMITELNLKPSEFIEQIKIIFFEGVLSADAKEKLK
ncbi:MAG: TetR/AcrR family transcriptional regulator [bacterium]